MDTTTNTTPSQLSPNDVAVMYAPAVLIAGGWLLAALGWGANSFGLFALGMMMGLCGIVMAGPMAVIALYRAIKVDTRSVIWWAALLDALALVGSGAVMLAASS